VTREVESDRAFQFAVFNLARHLKGVEELRWLPGVRLKPWVESWYRKVGHCLSRWDFASVYGRFLSAWTTVKRPAGDDVVKDAWEAIQGQPLPKEADAYDDPRFGLLMALCRQLQGVNERNGRDYFALSGYVAAKYLGVSQRTVADWMKVLVAEGLLDVVSEGGNFRGGRRMAREYRAVKRM
jgi:hypothetical protein